VRKYAINLINENIKLFETINLIYANIYNSLINKEAISIVDFNCISSS